MEDKLDNRFRMVDELETYSNQHRMWTVDFTNRMIEPEGKVLDIDFSLSSFNYKVISRLACEKFLANLKRERKLRDSSIDN